MSTRIMVGDVREQLRLLPDESVDIVICSPPYWGLRSYLAADHPDKHLEMGSEHTLGEHIDAMVDVFREMRRVMKSDAPFWLNYGDCYATAPNGRSAAATKAAGKDDRTFRDKPFSTVGPVYDPDGGQKGGGARGANKGNTGGANPGRVVAGGYLKPKDLCLIPFRLVQALQEPYHVGPIKREVDRAWLAGIIDADGCIGIRRESNGDWNPGFIPYLTVGCSDAPILQRCVEITGLGKVNLKSHAGDTDHRGIKQRRDGYVWRLDGQIASRVIRDIFPYLIQKRAQALVANAVNVSQKGGRAERGKPVPADVVDYRVRLYELIKALNQREDVILPDLPEVASNFEQGFWIRSRCMWGKPNGMPDSSGKYRPSVAHEEIFLLSKSGDLFYDAEAVSSPVSGSTHARVSQNVAAQNGSTRANGGRKTNGNMKAVVRGRIPGVTPKSAGEDTNVRVKGSFHASTTAVVDTRYLRTYEPEVWHIATAAYSEAHYATFPPALVERCLMAGTPKNRRCVVLDPFGGAGTAAMVADRMGHDAILIELNPASAELTRARMLKDAGMFADVA